jgi:hypothetical protein
MHRDAVRFFLWPSFAREYLHRIYQAVNEVDGAFRETRIMTEVEYYHGLIDGDVQDDPFSDYGLFDGGVAQWNTWLSERNGFLRGLLPAVDLEILTYDGNPISGGTITVNGPTVTLGGTAPISALRLEIDGSEDGIQWGTVNFPDYTPTTEWEREIQLDQYSDTIVVRTLDADGNEIEQTSINVICESCAGYGAYFTTGPLPAEPPLTVQFYGDSNASNVTAWDWDFGDELTGEGQDPQHTYARWGTYQVTLTVTADGGPYVYGQPITVGTPPPPVPGDLDGDYDVDQTDFGHLQACLAAPGMAPPGICDDADLDHDVDVDQNDATILLGCMSGPNVPGDPDCY